MRILGGFFGVLLSSVISFQAFAHEEGGVGKIQNEHLNLSYIDHVLSGSIGSSPVYAYPLPDQFGLSILHHIGSELFSSEFKKSEQVLSGKLRSKNNAGNDVETTLVITSMDPSTGTIKGTVDSDTFEVVISSAEMNGHHYVGPRFDIKVGTKLYAFDLKNGQACMGCAVKITYVVLGLLRVNGIL